MKIVQIQYDGLKGVFQTAAALIDTSSGSIGIVPRRIEREVLDVLAGIRLDRVPIEYQWDLAPEPINRIDELLTYLDHHWRHHNQLYPGMALGEHLCWHQDKMQYMVSGHPKFIADDINSVFSMDWYVMPAEIVEAQHHLGYHWTPRRRRRHAA